jgi:hypothetical protein
MCEGVPIGVLLCGLGNFQQLSGGLTMTPRWVCELLDRHGVHYEMLHRPEGFSPESLESDEHGLRQSAAES